MSDSYGLAFGVAAPSVSGYDDGDVYVIIVSPNNDTTTTVDQPLNSETQPLAGESQ